MPPFLGDDGITHPPPAGGSGGDDSADTGTTADGAACPSLENEGALVTVENVGETVPATIGGTIATGTYTLTAENYYTGVGGNAGPTGSIVEETLSITDATLVFSLATGDLEGGTLGDSAITSGTYTTSGMNILFNEDCPLVLSVDPRVLGHPATTLHISQRPVRDHLHVAVKTLRWGRDVVALTALVVCASGCAATIPASTPPPPATPTRYEPPSAWLCRPDLPTDACRGDLDATELRADGTRVVVPFVPASNPSVDCFYVYPTVDMGLVADNHVDFSDTSRMRDVARAQVARFGSVCRIFAPLYRQASIGTYFRSLNEREHRLDFAFADVLAAFRWYLAKVPPDRPVVLIGHSQGGDMIGRLLHELFDGDPAMRERLVVAMPIGWRVEVADGQTTGGTFANIPLCTSDDELGCIVTFRTFRDNGRAREWDHDAPPGRRSACVNPADVANGTRRWLSGALFPTHSAFVEATPGAAVVTTPYIVLPDFYAARCADGVNRFRYLAVAEAPAPGDTRKAPIDLDALVWKTKLGLHILDMQLAQGDLIALVARKAEVAAKRSSSPPSRP